MSAKRHRVPNTITTVPRSTLTHAHHKEIDTILRDLRICSRRLKSVLESFKDELRTLERLYYKCKNQHRMALFFRRVTETRRYGWRLCELDLLERVDLLRASFVGLEHTNDHKALRGPWSHAPEKLHICFLTERLTACSTLVCKMRGRLENAYHHFTSAMQTGAFIQLIILFVAISSRMYVLSSELDEALQLGISTCNRLLVIIHPMPVDTMILRQSRSEPESLLPARTDYDELREDTGQSVSRSQLIDASTLIIGDLGIQREATMDVRVTPPPSCSTIVNCDLAGGNAALLASKKTLVKANRNPQLKKPKKKFDEIDEIFGF